MFESVLIANRGEIACRIIATARRLRLRTIAVYSDADRGARHVRLADEAVRLGPPPARESYLDIEAVLAAARSTGAQCVHPGYGFLSENADFAARCAAAGLKFVGPSAAAIEQMGSKAEARLLMARSGVPVLPGYDGADQAAGTLQSEAARLGFPVLIKPTAGGGGKGMRIVRTAAELGEALASARREAAKAFGDDRLLLERFVESGRHVEIQVFADSHGQAVHLFERDCSLQRRHQKVIEEAPAPALPPETRRAMGEAAVAAARAVGYEGAGTVEFLYDGRGFYFLEMNTRLQVEHPVTEMVTGLDLVEWQLRVAAGERLPLAQAQIRMRGHAVEARLYAEDPDRGFLPSTGTIRELAWPATSAGLRIDSGVDAGDAIGVHYDPMLAKLICHAADRSAAIAGLRAALERVVLTGVRTNARFLWDILGDERVQRGDVSTRYLEQRAPTGAAILDDERDVAWAIAAAIALQAASPSDTSVPQPVPMSPWARSDGFRLGAPPVLRLSLRCEDEARSFVAHRLPGGLRLQSGDRSAGRVQAQSTHTVIEDVRIRDGRVEASVDGRRVSARIEIRDGATVVSRRCLRYEFSEDSGAEQRASAEHEGHVRAPMPGHVLDVRVTPGQRVEGGTVLVVLEAMKMEHSLAAPWAGTVEAVLVSAGARVEEGSDLVHLAPATAAEPGTAAPPV
jgi:3-methylcrotonyl-CoA carboxylase alpha subunit